MPVIIELTYEMAKALGGEPRFEAEAADVDTVVSITRERMKQSHADFDLLRARAAIAVNGVLVRHRDEGGTRLVDGDRVAFVKAAAGG